jgi:hypothetical protein
MTAPNFIQKSENMALSSLRTLFTHGLVNPDGTSCTPAGSFGETRITLRSAGASSIAFVSLSDSVKVTIQASGNAITADVICQRYHSLIG